MEELVPSKCRIIVVGQNYEKQANLTEPYYQTKYGVSKIDKDILKVGISKFIKNFKVCIEFISLEMGEL